MSRHTPQHHLRAAQPSTATMAANTAEHQARLAYRLTARDRWIAAMVHEHRVLTTTHIQRLAFPSLRSAEQRLLELHQWAMLGRFRPRIGTGTLPWHYVLGPAGATVLAAEHGIDETDLGYRYPRAIAYAHSLRLAHTVGVADFFTTLIDHAHRQPDSRVVAWWGENRCAAHFGDLVRPDAYGLIGHQRRPVEFFLEYDTGTENPARLGAKLAGYQKLAAATTITTPVLFWLTRPGREPAARTQLARAHAALDQPDLVPVATAIGGHGHSPFGPAWLPLHGGPRQSLPGLADVWPRLTPPDPDATGAPAPRPGLLPPVPPTPPAGETP